MTPADLEPIFARELIAQEVSTERFIEIPVEVQEFTDSSGLHPVSCSPVGKLWIPCRIYYKYEGLAR